MSTYKQIMLITLGALVATCQAPKRTSSGQAKHPGAARFHLQRAALGLSWGSSNDGWGSALPAYAAAELRHLRPKATAWQTQRDGVRRKVTYSRYRHHRRIALFDAQGRRLTGYAFDYLADIGGGHLAYSVPQKEASPASQGTALMYAGIRVMDVLMYFTYGPRALQLGLMNRMGQRITAPRYIRLLAVGPNTIWAVRADTCAPYMLPSRSYTVNYQLTYGLVDTLGRVVLPFEPGPLSLADTLGLIRRRRKAPIPNDIFSHEEPPEYSGNNTIRYYGLDGKQAFDGEFNDATAFWQGRAVVRVGQQYGVIDTLGRWIIPLSYTNLRNLPRTAGQQQHEKRTDPLRLFDPLDAGRYFWTSD